MPNTIIFISIDNSDFRHTGVCKQGLITRPWYGQVWSYTVDQSYCASIIILILFIWWWVEHSLFWQHLTYPVKPEIKEPLRFDLTVNRFLSFSLRYPIFGPHHQRYRFLRSTFLESEATRLWWDFINVAWILANI